MVVKCKSMLFCTLFLSLVTWGKGSLAIMGKYGHAGPQTFYKLDDIGLLCENVGLHAISDIQRDLNGHPGLHAVLELSCTVYGGVCVLGGMLDHMTFWRPIKWHISSHAYFEPGPKGVLHRHAISESGQHWGMLGQFFPIFHY